jgi:hypothetical protein
MSLIFTTGRAHGIDSIKNSQGSIMNKYVPGSGVGASNIAVRRAKSIRATARWDPPAAPVPMDVIPLNSIATYLRNYMTEFRNSNFYVYELDGNGNYINDGGDDMYDRGNFTTPWLLSGERYDLTYDYFYDEEEDPVEPYPYSISYQNTTSTTVDTNFKYVSLGYIEDTDGSDNGNADDSLHPLTVLGTRVSGPVGWQIGGEMGSDGSGTATQGYVYSNDIVNGFTVYAGYRQVYNASDPTICNLVILLGHPSWGSVFGPVTLIADNDDLEYCRFVMYSGNGSQNILAIYTLLSKPENDVSDPIPESEIQTVVNNFITRISQTM